MKKLLLSLAVVISMSASAIEMKDGVPVLDSIEKEKMELCAQQGGCYVMTAAHMQHIVEQYLAQQRAQFQANLVDICRNFRGSI